MESFVRTALQQKNPRLGAAARGTAVWPVHDCRRPVGGCEMPPDQSRGVGTALFRGSPKSFTWAASSG